MLSHTVSGIGEASGAPMSVAGVIGMAPGKTSYLSTLSREFSAMAIERMILSRKRHKATVKTSTWEDVASDKMVLNVLSERNFDAGSIWRSKTCHYIITVPGISIINYMNTANP